MDKNLTALLRQQVAALEASLEEERAENERLRKQLQEQEIAKGRLEAALAVHEQYQRAAHRTPEAKPGMVMLTPKHHAVLQMLVRGASNMEIAKRFGVKESTAKGFVRSIGKRFVSDRRITRREIVHIAMPIIEAMPPTEYERMATIPKTWDADWSPGDRRKRPSLYEKRANED